MLQLFLWFLLFTSLPSGSVEYSGNGKIYDSDSPLIFPEDDEDYYGEGSGIQNPEEVLLILDREEEKELLTKKCISSSSSSVKSQRNFITLCFFPIILFLEYKM